MKTSTPNVTLHELCDKRFENTPLYVFMQVFPYTYFRDIVQLTNIKLLKKEKRKMTYKELLVFLGIILLIHQHPDILRRNLWKTTSLSPHMKPSDLGSSGMLYY